MRRLILMRHAKSAWDAPGLADHDRALNARGRLAAPLIGAWLIDRDLVPDRAVISSSRRTRETWERMTALPADWPAPTIEPRLYEAEASNLMARITEFPEDARTALMLGHNPGMEELVSNLAERPLRMPTAAVALFESETDWCEIADAGARLAAFESPKSLV